MADDHGWDEGEAPRYPASIGDTPFGAFAVKAAIEGESLRGERLMEAPLMDGHDVHAPTPLRDEELDRPLISSQRHCVYNGEIPDRTVPMLQDTVFPRQ